MMRGAAEGAGGGAGAVNRREGGTGPGVRLDARPGRPGAAVPQVALRRLAATIIL